VILKICDLTSTQAMKEVPPSKKKLMQLLQDEKYQNNYFLNEKIHDN